MLKRSDPKSGETFYWCASCGARNSGKLINKGTKNHGMDEMREYVDLDVETPIRTEAGIWDYDYEKRKYVLRSEFKENPDKYPTMEETAND